MRVVTTYISRRFAWYFMLILFGMAMFSLTFELMEEADQIMETSQGQPTALLRYSLLRLPDILSQMLPIAALLGTLVTISVLMYHSELVAIWGSGVSVAGVMRTLLPIGLVLVVTQFALNDRAVPATLAKLHAWGVGDFQRGGVLRGETDTVWLRSGADIVALPRQTAREGRLENLQIFRRDESGKLIEMIGAADARRNGDTWDLLNATFYTVNPPATTSIPRLVWEGVIDVENIPLLSKDLRELPINEIRDLAVHEGYGQRPSNLYFTWLHYRIASAITPLLMMMLVVSLAHRFYRTGAFARLMLLSVTIGFGSFIFDNASLAMGEGGFLPPWVAAWSPNIAVVFVIGTFMARAEG